MSRNKEISVDHLYRQEYGKMVATLTRIFGTRHFVMIEDAVQDTFIKALSAWRQEYPADPQAWLWAAAKNRSIDLLRKLKADNTRLPKLDSGTVTIALNEIFLDKEIQDAQLRMIFMACHPQLQAQDQIAFALKSISGFSQKEIASALLLKEETVKKRLQRARKTISETDLAFIIPQGAELHKRLDRTLEVIYLIFNEGFHSGKADKLIRKDICGEALRLSKILTTNEHTRTPGVYALFALLCFQSSRIDSKIKEDGEIIDLEHQDRSLWFWPLVELGNHAMMRATKTDNRSIYHYEAAIIAEHLKAKSFDQTDWSQIHTYYKLLYDLQPSHINLLNIAYVKLKLGKLEKAHQLLEQIEADKLEQRSYLYYGVLAEYHKLKKEPQKAITYINLALEKVNNKSERKYLEKKRFNLLN